MLWHKVPNSIYFRRGSMATAMEDLKKFKRVCIVTDSFSYKQTPFVHELIDLLNAKSSHQNYLDYHVFYEAEDATEGTIKKGVDVMRNFKPDLIIVMGGGRTMEAAKLMHVLYEDPTADLKDLSDDYGGMQQWLSESCENNKNNNDSTSGTSIKKKKEFPKMGIKAKLVCIPTTSGSGTEVTPFATMVVGGGALGNFQHRRCPIAHFELTPFMAIIDANLVMNMPRDITAQAGMNALAHTIEAYASVCSNEFTDGQALQALKLLKTYLPRAYLHGKEDPIAREKVHNAATIAGIAHANAGMGICHSMGHALETLLNIPRGMAKALLLTNVVRYNTTHYTTSQEEAEAEQIMECQYAEMARHLRLTKPDDDSKDASTAFVEWLNKIKEDLSIPTSIQEWGIKENQFKNQLESLVEMAWEDPCVSTNSRPPSKNDLRTILLDSYYGRPYLEL
ncbi:unnamed protein product [Cylindrotheca closterium]|uniref:Alcohol dehydrogenase iron-type/glycerol dehydrogenase GldA domain-containing protein n=1 Tax=Cylindrotheca closterium TaxID=2856 RepID=A0AAD2JMS7_9STRA|nr:unnamed protein product [Cylindrotheca closterium]